jgi:hypothetical protein
MATIEIRDLTKRYGPVLAVDRLSFAVERGTVTGFLGPNGAGKAAGHRVRPSLIRELRAVAARFVPRSSSPAVPWRCPKQRFTAVANSQQSAAGQLPWALSCATGR